MSILGGAGKQPEGEAVPLSSAVFCMDCEVISNSRSDECPACHSHSLMSLARVLGGSLHDKKPAGRVLDSGAFDVTLTVNVQQMHAKDVNTTLEGLTQVISQRLAQGKASFHINVQPSEAESSRKAA